VEFDEDTRLTDYVWGYYSHLMTPFEQRVGRAIFARREAAIQTSPGMAAALDRLHGGFDDPEIVAALADGMDNFRRAVRDRLLRERAADVFVNRCPSCGGVAITPNARQCRCGFDWHAKVG